MGFLLPNKLQCDVFTTSKLDKNLLIRSKPGTGKTIATLLRILQNTKPDDFGVSGIYMVSSIESGCFVEKKLKLLSSYSKSLEPTLLIGHGNESHFEHLNDLNKDFKSVILIATPSFILKAIMNNMFKWDSVKNIVIDDLDRILEQKESSHTIETIFENPTRNKRITLTTSRMKLSLIEFVDKIVRNIEKIEPEGCDKETFADDNFKFFKMAIRESAKYRTLLWILEKTKYSKCVIFLKSTERVRRLYDMLNKNEGIRCTSIHNATGINRIINNLDLFVYNVQHKILLSTCAKGRCISMDGIDMVVNYDMPFTKKKPDVQQIDNENIVIPIERFINRIRISGRTTTTNKVFNFISSEENKQLLEEIENNLKITFNEVCEEDTNVDSIIN
eukprot:GAHX01000066.1.p1 GENE.GAHX01000066.1~~GAHX01000066.1.p1  ORF type:complete len:389 (-),score=74.35 GAHX01000066.1:1591-2757(-)